MPPAAPDPRLTRTSSVATSPRWPQACAEAAGVAAEGIPSPRRVQGEIRCAGRRRGRRRRDPGRPRARLRLTGGRCDRRVARGPRIGSAGGAPRRRPHRTESAPASCSRGSS